MKRPNPLRKKRKSPFSYPLLSPMYDKQKEQLSHRVFVLFPQCHFILHKIGHKRAIFAHLQVLHISPTPYGNVDSLSLKRRELELEALINLNNSILL